MSQVTLTFHADGEDYAVDFPSAQDALDWFGTVHPYENTVAIKVTKEEADTLLGRDPHVED